jgi:hypothetical protein
MYLYPTVWLSQVVFNNVVDIIDPMTEKDEINELFTRPT